MVLMALMPRHLLTLNRLLSSRLTIIHNLLLQLVRSVLLHKSDQTLECTITFVLDELACAGLFEFDGWETRDLEGGGGGDVVLGCVHLGAVYG